MRRLQRDRYCGGRGWRRAHLDPAARSFVRRSAFLSLFAMTARTIGPRLGHTHRADVVSVRSRRNGTNYRQQHHPGRQEIQRSHTASMRVESEHVGWMMHLSPEPPQGSHEVGRPSDSCATRACDSPDTVRPIQHRPDPARS